MTVLASAAFRLAMRGLHVFPLAPGTKIPIKGTHGCRGATQELDVVRTWWAKWPSANIAIATGKASGLWVLDLDVKEDVGLDGRASLADLEARHGPLPATIESMTPSGGRHLYWCWDDDAHEIRNSCGRTGPSIDVRGQGGSAVAPPSVLADGGRYRWAKSGVRTFADAPPWLVTLALPPPLPPRPKPKPLNGDVDRYCAAAITAELRGLAAAGMGQRNEQLNRAAYAVAQFVAAGAVPEDWARGELEGTAVQIGLPVIEARRTIVSAFAAGLRQPRDLSR
ncbi:MAG: bifunctional DNA primase/polymerase [bacterium]